MLERFTDPAREVVVLAEAEARRLSHDHIGAEHILLGLVRERHGVGAFALERLGVSLEAVRASVEQIVGPHQETLSDQLSFSPDGRRVLEQSLREALQLGHSHIGSEHLLLALIREKDSKAGQALRDLGVELNQVRQQAIRLLSSLEHEQPTESAGAWQAQTGGFDLLNRAPAPLVALARHVQDLRDGTHGGVEPRADKEALFERAVDWLAPVAWDVLAEVNDLLLLSRGELSDSDTHREDDGTLARTWTLSWPDQVERGLTPVTLRAWFGAGFHHPHLRGATVQDWPLNVYSRDDAVDMLPVLRSVVAADVHNLVFQADWRIIPAARTDS